ncbi:MAG: ribosome biogenesis GTPase Der, partial [Clostridia bacterium]
GKSTFFNKVAGSRISIVVNTPGVTRDRIYADGEWLGKQFTMIDTGGIELKSDDTMHKHIKEQAELAIDIADIILFFVDGREPLTSDDINIASILRKTKKPILLVVNKIDNFQTQDYSEFYSLGLDLFPISSEQKYGVGDLLDNIVERFPDIDTEKEAEGIKIAVVGKPNAGKSSLVNKILGYDRTIVTNIAGTTRDAIDTPFTVDGQKYVIIDTAGIRRKRSVENDTIEGYSVVRALAAVRRADVCLVVFDAEEGMSEQDVKIAGYVHEQGKPSIIVINKWDLIEKDTKTVEKYNNDLATDLAFMDYFKSITVSALTGQRVNKLIEQVNYVYEKHHLRITTGLLNDVVSDALSAVEPPSKKGKRLKIKYATEPAVAPPTFVFFVNDSSLVHFSYKRYLENSIRKSFSLDGTPIKLIFRDGEHKEEI